MAGAPTPADGISSNHSTYRETQLAEVFHSLETKPFSLFIDRNILSSLLQFCEKGHIKSEEAKRIGVLMTWANLCDIGISAGLAVQERAYQLRSQSAALFELQRFLTCLISTLHKHGYKLQQDD